MDASEGLLGIADALLYDGFHFVHMLQHILSKGNLAPGTNQVMIRAADVEIQVAVQIVCQESGGKLRRQVKADHGKGLDLRIRHGFRRHGQKPFRESPEDIQIHLCLVVVCTVLLHPVGRKADGIAEIMTHKPRHNGVKIDNDHRFLGFRRKQHVIDLGIVMGDPQRQLSCPVQIRQAAGLVLYGQQIINLLPDGRYPARFVLFHAPAEVGVPLAGIVEARNGLHRAERSKSSKSI